MKIRLSQRKEILLSLGVLFSFSFLFSASAIIPDSAIVIFPPSGHLPSTLDIGIFTDHANDIQEVALNSGECSALTADARIGSPTPFCGYCFTEAEGIAFRYYKDEETSQGFFECVYPPREKSSGPFMKTFFYYMGLAGNNESPGNIGIAANTPPNIYINPSDQDKPTGSPHIAWCTGSVSANIPIPVVPATTPPTETCGAPVGSLSVLNGLDATNYPSTEIVDYYKFYGDRNMIDMLLQRGTRNDGTNGIESCFYMDDVDDDYYTQVMYDPNPDPLVTGDEIPMTFSTTDGDPDGYGWIGDRSDTEVCGCPSTEPFPLGFEYKWDYTEGVIKQGTSDITGNLGSGTTFTQKGQCTSLPLEIMACLYLDPNQTGDFDGLYDPNGGSPTCFADGSTYSWTGSVWEEIVLNINIEVTWDSSSLPIIDGYPTVTFPHGVPFGENDTIPTSDFNIHNSGDIAIYFKNIKTTPTSTIFTFPDNPASIGAGGDTDFSISFEPPSVGIFTDHTVTITYDDDATFGESTETGLPEKTFTFTVTGTGTASSAYRCKTGTTNWGGETWVDDPNSTNVNDGVCVNADLSKLLPSLTPAALRETGGVSGEMHPFVCRTFVMMEDPLVVGAGKIKECIRTADNVPTGMTSTDWEDQPLWASENFSEGGVRLNNDNLENGAGYGFVLNYNVAGFNRGATDATAEKCEPSGGPTSYYFFASGDDLTDFEQNTAAIGDYCVPKGTTFNTPTSDLDSPDSTVFYGLCSYPTNPDSINSCDCPTDYSPLGSLSAETGYCARTSFITCKKLIETHATSLFFPEDYYQDGLSIDSISPPIEGEGETEECTIVWKSDPPGTTLNKVYYWFNGLWASGCKSGQWGEDGDCNDCDIDMDKGLTKCCPSGFKRWDPPAIQPDPGEGGGSCIPAAEYACEDELPSNDNFSIEYGEPSSSEDLPVYYDSEFPPNDYPAHMSGTNGCMVGCNYVQSNADFLRTVVDFPSGDKPIGNNRWKPSANRVLLDLDPSPLATTPLSYGYTLSLPSGSRTCDWECNSGYVLDETGSTCVADESVTPPPIGGTLGIPGEGGEEGDDETAKFPVGEALAALRSTHLHPLSNIRETSGYAALVTDDPNIRSDAWEDGNDLFLSPAKPGSFPSGGKVIFQFRLKKENLPSDTKIARWMIAGQYIHPETGEVEGITFSSKQTENEDCYPGGGYLCTGNFSSGQIGYDFDPNYHYFDMVNPLGFDSSDGSNDKTIAYFLENSGIQYPTLYIDYFNPMYPETGGAELKLDYKLLVQVDGPDPVSTLPAGPNVKIKLKAHVNGYRRDREVSLPKRKPLPFMNFVLFQ